MGTIAVERLAAHRIVGTIPPEEQEWLAAHGRLRTLQAGEVLTSRGVGVVEGLFIFLSGHIELHVNRANGRETIMEWHGGDVGGVLPYSRLTVPPGDTVASTVTEIIVIHRDLLPELIRECHCFTSALVHVMVDRARHFTSKDLQAEKMASLGKLSAGLAHELNNPASAIVRSARSLHEGIAASEDAAHALSALGLKSEQLAAIDEVRAQTAEPRPRVARSPLEVCDLETELVDWLRDHDVELDDAAPLIDSGMTTAMLDRLAASLAPAELSATLRWLAAGALTRQLTSEISEAATRISSLVNAVKGFTQMDLTTAPGPVDVTEGLAQTVAIHSARAGAKAVSVRLEAAPNLPRAAGVAGELNQVWSNLLENALDAVPQSGSVLIVVEAEGDQLLVSVIDDGPGVPEEIRSRVFDPFFTTKKVGQGTGLGLDIVKRIIQKHRGTVILESQPRQTVFKVALPLEGKS